MANLWSWCGFWRAALGLGCVGHEPLLAGDVDHEPQTLALTGWGAWATSPF